MNTSSDNTAAYQRYRRHFLRRDAVSFSILMALFILFNLLLFKADARIWPSGPVHDGLVALRCLCIISSLMAVIALFYTKRPEVFDRWTLGWGLMLALTNNLVILSRPATYTGNTMPELVAIIVLFAVMPDRMPHRILPSLFLAFGSLTLLFTVKVLPEPVALLSLLFAYLVAFVMGFWISHVFYRYRAEAFYANEELAQAHQEAEAANKAKSEFLALISHEIRTPLNALVGFSSLALKTTDSEKLSQYLEILEQSSRSLMELVNDILDMSKLEAGRMTLEAQPLNLRRMAAELDEQYRPLAEQKSLQLQVTLDPSLPDWISADPVRIRQIMANLVSNAVKFTERGSISCSLNNAGQNASGTALFSIVVQDSGIGIPREKMDRLFEPFHQLDLSITRKFGGTGLGLVIVRSLLEMMGGRIKVASNEGAGSCFTVLLPFTETVAPVDIVPQLLSVHPLSVLVVEDNPFNRLLLEDILVTWQHRVTLAEGGAQALLLLEQHRFDLILLDIRMPGVDGIEVARRFREKEQLQAKRLTPIIAITADADMTTQEVCLLAGINRVLAKPVSPERLAAVVAELCGNADTTQLTECQQLNRQAYTGLGGNQERAQQFLQILQQDIDQQLQILQKSSEDDDRERMRSAAHTLKGLLSNLDNPGLVEKTAWLQQNAGSADCEQIRQLIVQLQTIKICGGR